MPVSFEGWRTEILRLALDVPKKSMSVVVRKIALDSMRLIILRSPVGNPDLWKMPAPPGYVGGRFRANWFVSLGTINAQVEDVVDASGARSQARATMTIPALAVDPFQIVYFHNSLHYAMKLESGWSTQAPNGVVYVVMDQLQAVAGGIVV
jgi:hypothetical protein